VEPSDEALCRRVAEQDERAFEQLVERHRQRAYRLAWSILRDGEEAKDISQEAFLRLYEKAAGFDGRSKFSTWFHRLLVNLCIDRRRQRSSWLQRLFRADTGDDLEEELERVPSPVEDPAVTVERRQAVSRAWEIAGRLPARQRAALALQIEEDLPASEIAAILECSEATVRVHLHRALSTLRKALRDG
jgi:RNA polymerase sigma-70 factor (ECF subfamily)